MRHALQKNIVPGQQLIPVVKFISQDKINRFGIMSAATGAIHLDPAFGKASPMGSTLAHGFLTAAYICEMMEVNFGRDWASSGELETKFIGAARPGDTVMTGGTITKCDPLEGGLRVECEVTLTNQDGAKLVAGTAALTVANRADAQK